MDLRRLPLFQDLASLRVNRVWTLGCLYTDSFCGELVNEFYILWVAYVYMDYGFPGFCFVLILV